MKQRFVALRYFVSSLAVSMAFGLVCFAQQTSPPAGSKPAATQTAPAKEWPADKLGSLAAEWTRAKNWNKEYLDKMPEDGMNFKPVPEVRSFAEQMLHLASANGFYGNRGTGAANPFQGKDLTKMDEYKTKAGLTKVVMESYDFVINSIKGMDAAKLDERQAARGMNIPRSDRAWERSPSRLRDVVGKSFLFQEVFPTSPAAWKDCAPRKGFGSTQQENL